MPTRERIKLDSYLSPHIQINSQLIKDLNVALETLQRKTRGKLFQLVGTG